jgi:hypothetical protein
LNIRYKVVETQTVTDDTLEKLLNQWTAKGWQLDSIRFAMSDASKRPAMAYILFVREEDEPGEGQGNDLES